MCGRKRKNKQIKRKISIIAAILLALGLAACGNNEAQKTEAENETETIMDQTGTSDSASDVPEAERGLMASDSTEGFRRMSLGPGWMAYSKTKRMVICRLNKI